MAIGMPKIGDQGAALPPEDNEQRQEKLCEEIATIIRSVSGKYNLEIRNEMTEAEKLQQLMQGHDPDKAWFRHSETHPVTGQILSEYVYFPPQDLERVAEAKGKAAHEAGHVAVTRLGFVKRTDMTEAGLRALIMSAEEVPTDHSVIDRLPGAAEWLLEARRGSLRDGQEALRQYLEEHAGEWPKVSRMKQLSNLIVYAEYMSPEDWESREYSEEVKAAFEKIKKPLSEFGRLLPERGAAEKQVVVAAKARHKILKDKIWPVFRELVDEDIADEIAQNTLNGGKGSGGEGGANPEQAIENKLSAKGKKELEALREDPGAEMSPELVQEIQKIFESLPKEVQRQILERAMRVLAEIEDKIIEELRSQISDETVETNQETQEREQSEVEERRSVEDAKKIEAEIEEKRRFEQSNWQLATYNTYYDQVRDQSRELFEVLEEVLMPNVKTKTRRVTTGSKLNLKALYRFQSGLAAGATQIDDKIFEVTHQPEKKDYAFTIMVDMSGSMAGSKITEAFKGVVLLVETINRLGIKVELLGFKETLWEFKKFSEELNDAKRQQMSGIIHSARGDNYDGICLQDASKRMGQQAAMESFIIVISDGQPCGPRVWKGEDVGPNRYLTNAIGEILRDTDQHLVGIGLGPGTQFVSRFYPVSLPEVGIQELVKTLGGLLKDIVEHPETFRSKSV